MIFIHNCYKSANRSRVIGYFIDMPTGNPYRKAHQITRRRQGPSWSAILTLVGALLAAPLAKPTLLYFADFGVNPAGVEQLALRLGAVLIAIMALQTYTDIVRSPERSIISLHPVLPRPFLMAVALRTLRQSVIWPIAFAAIISPLLWIDVRSWGWLVLFLLSSWIGGLGVGYAVNLGSIWVARNERAHTLLDAIRGSNPREQAAFIYAPGFALAVLGLGLALASGGVRAILEGRTEFGVLVGLPFVFGLIGFWLARHLVQQELVRGVMILAEVDARWKQVSDDEQMELAVYLEWVAKDRAELLRALRQGWRNHRLFPNLGWVCGVLSALSILSDQFQAAWVLSSIGLVGMGLLPFRLASGDPTWLDRALGVSEGKIQAARTTVTMLYSFGIVLPIGLASLWKMSELSVAPIIGLLVLGGLCSTLGGIFVRNFGTSSMRWYLPCGVVLWGVTMRFIQW